MMAAHQTKAQKNTVGRVMHEFKHKKLETSAGRKVKNAKQAIAIALREAGASKYESGKKNQENLRRTKAREGRAASGENTRAQLYEEARRKDIPGRSKMTKDELERAMR